MDQSISIGNEKDEEAGGLAEEIFYNIKTVHSFGNYNFELKRYKEKIQEVYNSRTSSALVSALISSIINLIGYFGYAIIIYYSAHLFSVNENINGRKMKTGDLSFLVELLFRNIIGLMEATPNIKAMIEASISAYDYFKLDSDTKKKEEKNNKKNLENNQINNEDSKNDIESYEIFDSNNTDIEFIDVNFSYPSKPSKKILENLNLKFEENTLNAIVGASGSGKSTIISLIERFYEIDSGEILLGGKNIKNFDKNNLRNLIGYVPQEPMLFNISIKENILIGRDCFSDKEITEACKLANAFDFINNLEKGIDTIVGVSGSKFSGGQKQRIAIARAILGKPKILIFDEATSALDVQSEKKIQKAINFISKKITTIVIAHRLSTIKKADKIIVLKNGKCEEFGTHENLKQKSDGIYASLINNEIVNENNNKDCEEISKNKIINYDSYNSHYSYDNYNSNKNFILNDFDNNDNESDDENILIENSNNISFNNIDEEEKNLKIGKALLKEILFEKNLLFYFALFISMMLGILFPLDGLLMGKYMETIEKDVGKNPEKIMENGKIYLAIYLFYSVVVIVCLFFQK